MKPGEHGIALESPLAARQAGFQVRDSILILLPGGRVLVASLGRQPLDGTVAENVTRHGVGALWIDGCRVATDENLNGGAYAGKGQDRADGYEVWRYKRLGDAGEYRQPTGRWPTNLLLVHGLDCRQVGSKRIKGSHDTTGIWGAGFSGVTYGVMKGLRNRQTGYTSPDGLETVPDWECQPDCPARLLDEQSGDCRSACGGGCQTGARGGTGLGFHGLKATGLQTGVYHDAGTASRYFPQFASLDDALAWLRRLVSGQCGAGSP